MIIRYQSMLKPTCAELKPGDLCWIESEKEHFIRLAIDKDYLNIPDGYTPFVNPVDGTVHMLISKATADVCKEAEISV